MANRLPYLLPALAVLAACSAQSDTAASRRVAADGTSQPAAAAQLRVPLGSPVFIDSSACVMYPLSLREIETKNENSYGSYSEYNRTSTYWNILFYNLKTGQSHLLGLQKMVVNSYAGENQNTASADDGEGRPRLYTPTNLLYFSVTTVDFNHDGRLTEADPAYLFVSDKTGANFRQVSPDSLHVAGWEIHHATGNILLQTVQDSNHDRKFGAGDEDIPYVYNVASQQPARRVFSPASMQQLRLRFQQQWPQKPE